MAFIHGRFTFVSIDGQNISTFTDTTDFDDKGSEAHETTTYGQRRKTYSGGLGDGSVSIGGTSDDGASGPRAVLKPLMAAGLPVEFIFRPHGTGTGKAQSIVDVLVTGYKESNPVGGMVKWTAELQMTGDLDETAQA